MSCVYSADTLYATWGDTRNGKMNIYFAKTIASTNITVGISILEGEEPPLLVFPNPAKNYLNIRVKEELLGNEIFVFDAHGKEVKSVKATKNQSIDVSQLPSGCYWLSFKNNTDQAQRFIKH